MQQIANTFHTSRATIYRALTDEGDFVYVVYRSGKTKTDSDGPHYDETGQGDRSKAQYDADRMYWPLADHKRPHAKAMVYVVADGLPLGGPGLRRLHPVHRLLVGIHHRHSEILTRLIAVGEGCLDHEEDGPLPSYQRPGRSSCPNGCDQGQDCPLSRTGKTCEESGSDQQQ
ncbi:hypothetical protein AB0C81_14120 [Streptomyces roseoverticillatus]|uniref:hypothetical protein n=1 Tax=Streptomyces roseoverticillatus TaxID=66429 RepID=UPI0033D25E2A